jgi:hypothetical protein
MILRGAMLKLLGFSRRTAAASPATLQAWWHEKMFHISSNGFSITILVSAGLANAYSWEHAILS